MRPDRDGPLFDSIIGHQNNKKYDHCMFCHPFFANVYVLRLFAGGSPEFPSRAASWPSLSFTVVVA